MNIAIACAMAIFIYVAYHCEFCCGIGDTMPLGCSSLEASPIASFLHFPT